MPRPDLLSDPLDTFPPMANVKYTHEVLSAAVAASTSMAGVLRHLGLRQNGGSHAHLRRRIDQLGIDTSHFLGQAHARGMISTHRRSAAEVLIERPQSAKRAAPPVLTRALLEIGRLYTCAACSLGDAWNGQSITLHVDHIDGRFWDSRADNLRFLCPNCHSQTGTYAGRNRSAVSAADEPLSEEAKIEVLARVGRNELTVSDAARLIGCNRDHVYQLRRRLAHSGTLAAATSRPRPSASDREVIVAFALQNPMFGIRRLAEELRRHPDGPVLVGHGTVSRVLHQAGLNTQAARITALSGMLNREGDGLESPGDRLLD